MSVCLDCSKPLNRRNTSGRCKVCFGKAIGRSEHRRQAISATRAAMWNIRPRMAALSRSRLAWCPPEYREDYRHLSRVKGVLAAEARAMILDAVAADRRALEAGGRFG